MRASLAGTALLLCAILAGCTARRESGPVTLESLSFADYSIYEPGLTPQVSQELESLRDRPVYHISLIVDPSLQIVTGRSTLRLINRTANPLSSFDFLLFPNRTGGELAVDAVSTRNGSLDFEYTEGRIFLRVHMPEALLPGEEIILTMAFTLTVPNEKSIGYGSLYYEADTLSLGYFYPLLPSIRHSPTLSPLAYGDHSFSDASFYCVQITAPRDFQIFAAGYRVTEQEADGLQTVLYAAGPARDFYVGLRKEGVVESRRADSLTLQSYASPDHRESAVQCLDYAEKSIRIFSTSFGEYPYLNFTLASMPLTALGLEFPGIIINSESMYTPGNTIRGVSTQVLLESTTVHEVAHQWFYNLVGNDQRTEPWIDEGLAQYGTWLYYRECYGENAADQFRDALNGRWKRIGRKKISIGLPVSAYSGEEYGAIIYGRAPLMFIELAETVGEACFFESLQAFVREARWENGTGEQLRQAFAENCDLDLDPFFQEWFEEEQP